MAVGVLSTSIDSKYYDLFKHEKIGITHFATVIPVKYIIIDDVKIATAL